MRIRTIGIVSLMAAVALLAGADAGQAKTGKKHSTKSHCTKTHKECCSEMECCAKHGGNDAGVVIYKKGNCKTELELMKKAGVCNVLCGKGPITVFCPTDEAYSKLGKAGLDEIKSDPKKLAELVKYHILNKKVMAGDIQAKGALSTSAGESLITNSNNGKAEVDGAMLIEQDIPCSNGVVHIIDEVLIPERGK